MADTVTTCPACGKAAGQSAGGGAAATQASGGLQNNLAGALAYLWIVAIIFLLIEPYNQNKFVRFHSFQALFLGLVSIAGHIVLGMVPVLGWVILPFFSLAIFVVAIICAVKAFQNQEFKLPVLGDLAAKQV
jgi:uncharacterized membrane protein